MWLCPYCGNDRPELRQCCGEIHSIECSEEAIAHADKTGSSPLEVQEDFEAWMAKRINEREQVKP